MFVFSPKQQQEIDNVDSYHQIIERVGSTTSSRKTDTNI
jgi:hypothetical protein